MLEMFALPAAGPALYSQNIIQGTDVARQFAAGMSALSDVPDMLLAASREVEAALSQEMPLGGASDIGRPPALIPAADGLLKDVPVNFDSCGLHLPPEMESVDYAGTARERQQVRDSGAGAEGKREGDPERTGLGEVVGSVCVRARACVWVSD